MTCRRAVGRGHACTNAPASRAGFGRRRNRGARAAPQTKKGGRRGPEWWCARRGVLFRYGFEPQTFRVLSGCDNQLHHRNLLARARPLRPPRAGAAGVRGAPMWQKLAGQGSASIRRRGARWPRAAERGARHPAVEGGVPRACSRGRCARRDGRAASAPVVAAASAPPAAAALGAARRAAHDEQRRRRARASAAGKRPAAWPAVARGATRKAASSHRRAGAAAQLLPVPRAPAHAERRAPHRTGTRRANLDGWKVEAPHPSVGFYAAWGQGACTRNKQPRLLLRRWKAARQPDSGARPPLRK
eukprot:scaffold4090_cov302-Prasinococcus_capsulatus_cf.AAC.1